MEGGGWAGWCVRGGLGECTPPGAHGIMRGYGLRWGEGRTAMKAVPRWLQRGCACRVVEAGVRRRYSCGRRSRAGLGVVWQREFPGRGRRAAMGVVRRWASGVEQDRAVVFFVWVAGVLCRWGSRGGKGCATAGVLWGWELCRTCRCVAVGVVLGNWSWRCSVSGVVVSQVVRWAGSHRLCAADGRHCRRPPRLSGLNWSPRRRQFPPPPAPANAMLSSSLPPQLASCTNGRRRQTPPRRRR